MGHGRHRRGSVPEASSLPESFPLVIFSGLEVASFVASVCSVCLCVGVGAALPRSVAILELGVA